MNGPLEPWSTPWHALLKDLANGVKSESQDAPGIICRPGHMQSTARPDIAPIPTVSWLGRARSRALFAALLTP